MHTDEKIAWLKSFASKLGPNIELELDGEVGFGRPCIGIARKDDGVLYGLEDGETIDTFLSIDPHDWVKNNQTELGYEVIYFFPNDIRLSPPEDVDMAPHRYHKFSCTCILVGGRGTDLEDPVDQLYAWMQWVETQGEPFVDSYTDEDIATHLNPEHRVPVLRVKQR